MHQPEHYPFSPHPLPYPLNALSPWVSANTLKLHHRSHYAGYINKLNDVLKGYPQLHNLPIEALLLKQALLPEKARSDIRKYAGGAFNHQMYFEGLAPIGKTKISAEFEKIICNSFGSVATMLSKLKEAAMSVFGSGYAWLVSDKDDRLVIITLPNQDTPIEQRLNPVLPIDVWEHAYYLQYQNHRERYLNSLCKLINWRHAEKNYFT